jgi:uncharacterized protein YjbI with pentapeptide repeats
MSESDDRAAALKRVVFLMKADNAGWFLSEKLQALIQQSESALRAMKKEEGSMAHPEHLEQLKQGVAAWNRWRQEHPEIQPDLSELDTADLVAGKLDRFLNEVDFRHVVLRNARLSGVFFANAHLQGTDLSEADLYGARFWKADLTGACLRNAVIELAVFAGAQLQRADLTNAEGAISELDGDSDGPPAGVSGPFSAANLRYAILNNAHFESARFRGVNLEEAMCVQTRFNYADLNNANLHGANFQQAEFVGADLRGADLRETNLQGAIFNAANPTWTGTRLSGTLPPPLLGADLRGANFRGADLRGVDLTGADFSESCVEGVLF